MECLGNYILLLYRFLLALFFTGKKNKGGLPILLHTHIYIYIDMPGSFMTSLHPLNAHQSSKVIVVGMQQKPVNGQQWAT